MTDLQPEVRDFISASIDSPDALEILLLLRRSPQTFWTASAVAERLALALTFVAATLALLHGRRLLAIGNDTGAYRYAPANDRLTRCIDALAAVHHQDRAAIESAIRSARHQRTRVEDDPRLGRSE